ncbi:CHRD domain-containing protein [bacterium]|nr:CHRD domain-containing protein [bacterium]
MRIAKVLFCLALVMAGVGAAQAAVVYEAELMPEYVVPPSGASAYGQATLIVNDDETLAYLTVNFAGLDTDQTDAALLIGMDDEAGTVYTNLDLGSPLAMTMDYTMDLDEALDTDTLAIQIYSQDWPEGAIRGNFEFVTVPTEANTWSQVKGLF